MTYKNGKMTGKSLHNHCRYRLPPAVLPLTLPPAVTLPYLCRFACLPAAFIACPCA
jgi:hypothetical protein